MRCLCLPAGRAARSAAARYPGPGGSRLRLQPGFENLDQDILVRAAAAPERRPVEPHMVERQYQGGAAEGQILRVGEVAQVASDDACLPTQIMGRADMARATPLWPVVPHADQRSGGDHDAAATAAFSSASSILPLRMR